MDHKIETGYGKFICGCFIPVLASYSHSSVSRTGACAGNIGACVRVGNLIFTYTFWIDQDRIGDAQFFHGDFIQFAVSVGQGYLAILQVFNQRIAYKLSTGQIGVFHIVVIVVALEFHYPARAGWTFRSRLFARGFGGGAAVGSAGTAGAEPLDLAASLPR